MVNFTKPDQNEMLKSDYTYCTDYDYDTEFRCEEAGCYEEGICRCGSIVNSYVKSVNLSTLTNEIYSQFMPEDKKSRKRENRISEILYGGEIIDKYCIYRILVKNKVFIPDNWNVVTCHGYYGDEIESVCVDTHLLTIVNKHCEKLFTLNTLSEKLKYVIELEYGYLLDDLKDCDFELISIYKNYIDFKKLNQNHIKMVKMKDLDYYSSDNYDLPRGIVREDSAGWIPVDNYKIVDGFHRMIAAPDRKSFQVFCIKK